MADIDKTDDVGVKAVRKPVDQGLRNLLKAIAAGGVGTALFGAGYLTGRRSLEEEFRQKFTEKTEQILQLEQAIQDITTERNELQAQLDQLSSDYDRVMADYNRAQDIIHLSDSLETETVEALYLYRTKEKEAINELYRIVARYAEKLGGDRVKAEKAAADILSTSLEQRTKLEHTISEKQRSLDDASKQLNESRKYARVPINENPDFSGDIFNDKPAYWDVLHVLPELGFPEGLSDTRWGYRVVRGDYVEMWMENPRADIHDHILLTQGPWTHPHKPKSTWYLKDHHFRLEVDLMVVEDEPIVNDERSWSRFTIGLVLNKIDGSIYSSNFLLPDGIFSEFDIYRRNIKGCADRNLGVIEYHMDQIPKGQWRHYVVDINDLVQNGMGTQGCGGWGKEWHDQSFLNQWTFTIESLASKTKVRIKNAILYKV